jgi:ribosomal protein S12 methylthiotransferase
MPGREVRMTAKVKVITLGCDKNSVDTSYMEGLLQENFQVVEDTHLADVVIVNTCSFIESAKQDSINAILEVAELKKEGCCRYLIVTGCLAERYPSEISQCLPEVDAIIGLSEEEKIVGIIEQLNGRKIVEVSGKPRQFKRLTPRSTPQKPYEFIIIGDGCSNYCSYCVIPKIRGSFRSRPLEHIVAEANWLVEKGVREIILVGQDTSAYGVDLYGRTLLPELLWELVKIKELSWLRLLYLHPARLTKKFLQTILELDKLCPYLEIPLQHVSDHILKRMKRWGSEKIFRKLFAEIRQLTPDIALRTSFIIGFPGETEADYKQLVNFIKDVKFDYIGFFGFSAEEGTEAYYFKKRISSVKKQQRLEEITALQDDIAWQLNNRWLGKELEVLVERTSDENNYDYVGRMARQAPEVDGAVYLQGKAQIGEFAKVKIDEHYGYDFYGRVV